ncbi:MAG: tetratricopeptide repeat protein [Melioribacteraceae bacterium]|nr:tetratricopeptide repeat protein [Melioribacteraceae bacterium]
MAHKHSTIIDELYIELHKFFSEEESERLYKLLLEADKKAEEEIDYGAENNKQIYHSFGSGSTIRDQIDKLLTFTEKRVTQNINVKLAISLTELMISYGEFELAGDLNDEYLKKFATIDQELTAEMYLQKSKIQWNQGEWKTSRSFCTKARSIYEELNNSLGLAYAENMFGTIEGEQGNIEKAFKHFYTSISYLQEENNDSLKAKIFSNIGVLANMLGKYDEAKKNLSESLNYYSRLNEPRNVARVYHNLGMLSLAQRDYKTAINYFDQGITISIDKGYLSNCAISFIGKASAYSMLGEAELSDAFAEKAFEIAYKINDRLSIADVYKVKGIIYKLINNNSLSEEFFENSIRLNEDFQNQVNLAEAELELSKLYNESEKKLKGEELLELAKKYYKKVKAADILKNL